MFKNTIPYFLITACFFQACSGEQAKNEEDQVIEFTNKGHELVYNMVETVGNYGQLQSLKDVTYTYSYQTPDGKKDVSTEKYIFAGELSYGYYHQHERTLAELEGVMEQGFDGSEYWLKIAGEVSEDEEGLKKVKFNRPTNYYWFTMFQKLLDPGIIYEHLGEESIDDQQYDMVKISFESKNDEASDIYQLYINQETNQVDQFLFTVVEYGVVDNPMLMQLEYEEIEGLMIPTKRRYKKSTWDASVSEDPWILVDWTDVKFNTNLSTDEFTKEYQMEIEDINKGELKTLLDEKIQKSQQSSDTTKKRIYREGIESVMNAGIVQSALQVGDTAPNFELNNASGNPIALYDYLKEGPVVLTWYRGGWCPYCNLTLHQLQKELPNFKANGANLLALTPELPDQSITTAEKNELEFEVLSDIDSKIAKEFGIVFKLTDQVAKIYEANFGLSAYNGNTDNELPLAATYIIDQNGVIKYAFLDADYRKRAEPADLTKVLKNL